MDYWNGFEVPFYITTSLFIIAAFFDALSELTVKSAASRQDSKTSSDKYSYGSILDDDTK